MGNAPQRYRFEARHPVSGLLLDGNLRLVGPKWSRLVADNGAMTATVAVPDPKNQAIGGPVRIARLRASVAPLAAAWYVKNADTGQYVWGGPVISSSWDPGSQSLAVQAVEWRSWFYKVPLIPDAATGRDVPYSWAATDQISIARQIAALVLAEQASPHHLMPAYTASGKLRDFSVYGSELKSAGDLIDSLAQREGGFEWSVEIVADEFGEPRPAFTTWYPRRGSSAAALSLRSDTESKKSNLMSYGPVEDSGDEKYSRFWATGAGQAPDVVLASDSDPGMSGGAILRIEGSAAYTSVTQRGTVAEYARANRLFYAQGAQTMTVKIPIVAPTLPDIDSWNVGDRAALHIRDRWVDVDLPAVRVLSREIDPTEGSAMLLLDLSDGELPNDQ